MNTQGSPLPFEEHLTKLEGYPDTISFQVEGIIFTVSRKPFLYPGNFFERRLAPPSRLGESIAMPITVPPNITKDDFCHFVWALQESDNNEDVELSTLYEWRGVMHLATKWDFPVIRRKAIKALSPIVLKSSITEQLCWIKDYQVKSWFMVVYTLILVSPKSIPQDELRKADIGWAHICKLHGIREKWLEHLMYGTGTGLGVEISIWNRPTPGSELGSGSGSEAGEETDSEMDHESVYGSGTGSSCGRSSRVSKDSNSAGWFGMPLKWARTQLEIFFADELLCMRND